MEMCRRDHDFTAVNAIDPDLDADIRGDDGDGDVFDTASIHHAAAAVAAAGGLAAGDSHTPDIDLARSVEVTPTLHPQANPHGAAFDGGHVYPSAMGSGGGGDYPAAQYDAHPDDLALGYSHSDAAAAASDISGMASPALGPAGGVSYHSIDGMGLTPAANSDHN